MDLERIRRRVSGGGFRPFALRSSDGHQYAIRHPELVLIAARSLAIVDSESEIVTLDPLHVAAIKDLKTRANGRPKR